MLLLQGVTGPQSLLSYIERFRLLRSGVDVLHLCGIAEQKTHSVKRIEFVRQKFIAVNGEVRRYEIEGLRVGQAAS